MFLNQGSSIGGCQKRQPASLHKAKQDAYKHENSIGGGQKRQPARTVKEELHNLHKQRATNTAAKSYYPDGCRGKTETQSQLYAITVQHCYSILTNSPRDPQLRRGACRAEK